MTKSYVYIVFIVKKKEKEKVMNERNERMSKLMADYYLSSYLTANSFSEDIKAFGKANMEEIAKVVCPIIEEYIPQAVISELENTERHCHDIVESSISGNFLEKRETMSKVEKVSKMSKKKLIDFLDNAAKIFGNYSWDRQFGGESWAKIAKLGIDFIKDQYPKIILADMAFSTQHNTGTFFDKLYRFRGYEFDTMRISEVLTAQQMGNIESLLEYCNKDMNDFARDVIK